MHTHIQTQILQIIIFANTQSILFVFLHLKDMNIYNKKLLKEKDKTRAYINSHLYTLNIMFKNKIRYSFRNFFCGSVLFQHSQNLSFLFKPLCLTVKKSTHILYLFRAYTCLGKVSKREMYRHMCIR